MNYKFILLFILFFSFFSCNDDTSQRKIEQEKQAKKNEAIFDYINRGWIFELTPLEPITQSKIDNWIEWRAFITEINQKPQSSIGAFQKKAKTLAQKSVNLEKNIPLEFDKPQIKARIRVVETKIKSMNLFINLNQIQEKKVVKLIGEINKEIDYLQLQFEEIVTRSQIPREDGEPDIIMMKDTTRAVQNNSIDPDLE